MRFSTGGWVENSSLIDCFALGRDDEEGVHLAGRAQVLLGHALHRAADLQQRRGQRARAAGDHGGAAVGRELAVARERLEQHERDA